MLLNLGNTFDGNIFITNGPITWKRVIANYRPEVFYFVFELIKFSWWLRIKEDGGEGGIEEGSSITNAWGSSEKAGVEEEIFGVEGVDTKFYLILITLVVHICQHDKLYLVRIIR